MKVILLESTNNVGMVGEIVNVRPGFARNYLLPQKKAVVANENNMKVFEHQKRMLEKRIEKAKLEAQELKKTLDDLEITLIRKTAKANKLFGSVTSLDIQKAILDAVEVEVNRKSIILAEPIKKIGSYNIKLSLDGGVESNIQVHVEPDPLDIKAAEELEAQAKEEEAKAKAQAAQEEAEKAKEEAAEATEETS